jgi:hypothetical protein
MSCVALLGSDRVGLRWGPPAMWLGPLAYLVVRKMGWSGAMAEKKR